MMDWVQVISYLCSNELRLLLGLYLVAKLTDFHLERKALLLTGIGGCLATILQAVSLPTIGVMAVEVLVITAVAGYYQRKKVNLCLFLAFFYEIGVGLWDFLLQAGLGILFRSENFIDPKAPEYLAGIWLVRLVMLGVAVFLAKQPKESTTPMRLTSAAAMLALFGAVTLSQQTILPLSDEQAGTWVILSMVLLFSILFYRLS